METNFAHKDGSTFEIPVTALHFTEQGIAGEVGGAEISFDGVISTRRDNAESWTPVFGKSLSGKRNRRKVSGLDT